MNRANCGFRNAIILSTTSDLLLSPADEELLFIANSEASSYLIVPLNLKVKAPWDGSRLKGFAVDKLDG